MTWLATHACVFKCFPLTCRIALSRLLYKAALQDKKDPADDEIKLMASKCQLQAEVAATTKIISRVGAHTTSEGSQLVFATKRMAGKGTLMCADLDYLMSQHETSTGEKLTPEMAQAIKNRSN